MKCDLKGTLVCTSSLSVKVVRFSKQRMKTDNIYRLRTEDDFFYVKVLSTDEDGAVLYDFDVQGTYFREVYGIFALHCLAWKNRKIQCGFLQVFEQLLSANTLPYFSAWYLNRASH